ncbi:GrpB-like predicted nucleotidyltransferase (UPF0157 family) [Bacillus pakistanensis]|uniref:GrpB-like predicted nucleotidyltransferase (UPF0157 family) n=1 Tax=Rossellomorea pakistanensis TaxID=992288 RepID=A0ABS2N711_9BACI|nr:GrpB-like predicted nucleotidyltransferase (UPF0157 family) [Bacillus pakistanensis]
MGIEVIIEKYNHHWITQYENEKTNILNAIGDFIIDIQHIGSTAIPGLGAKPIIDMMAGVSHLNGFNKFIDPLHLLDYEYVPKQEVIDRKFFRKGRWRQGTVHLHICEYKSNEWKEKLLFRDFLRAHPNKRDEYFELKKKLASKFKFDRPAYTAAKTNFINDIIKLACLRYNIK